MSQFPSVESTSVPIEPEGCHGTQCSMMICSIDDLTFPISGPAELPLSATGYLPLRSLTETVTVRLPPSCFRLVPCLLLQWYRPANLNCCEEHHHPQPTS